MIFSRTWKIGLFYIIIIYIFYHLLFLENKNIEEIPRKFRHLIKFISTASIYIIGTIHLSNFKVRWMEKLWHLIHLTMLFFLLFLGLFVWFISDIPIFLKSFSVTIQELLISPSLYFVMGLLNEHLKLDSNNNLKSKSRHMI